MSVSTPLMETSLQLMRLVWHFPFVFKQKFTYRHTYKGPSSASDASCLHIYFLVCDATDDASTVKAFSNNLYTYSSTKTHISIILIYPPGARVL